MTKFDAATAAAAMAEADQSTATLRLKISELLDPLMKTYPDEYLDAEWRKVTACAFASGTVCEGWALLTIHGQMVTASADLLLQQCTTPITSRGLRLMMAHGMHVRQLADVLPTVIEKLTKYGESEARLNRECLANLTLRKDQTT